MVVDLVVAIIVATSLALPGVQACLSPYGFLDFEPKPLAAPGGDVEMAPIDVSASTVDDLQPELMAFKGDLYAFWVKETGVTEVTENVMCRVQRDGAWGDLWAVNNPVPEEGSFNASGSRVAGFEALVHDGLLTVLWSTPYKNFTGDEDNDIVFRTYDGTSWSEVVDIIPPGDGSEDVQPSAVSLGDQLLVAWSTNNPEITGGTGMVVVSRVIEGEEMGPIRVHSELDPDKTHFIPELFAIPGGAYLTWYTREVVVVDSVGTKENAMLINGMTFVDGVWSEPRQVSYGNRDESIWVSALWDGDGLCFVWQYNDIGAYWKSSQILYREWRNGTFGPIQDLTGPLDSAVNGKPRICLVEEGLRVYWHTNDDGLTVGDTFDMVWREREGEGHWGPVEVFRSDPDKNIIEIGITSVEDVVYGTWLTNMTYEAPGPGGEVDVWDVVVGPLYIPENPLKGVTVTHRWSRAVEAWGPVETIRFVAKRDGTPMGRTLLSMEVVDPQGNEETELEGRTDGDGTLMFDHSFEGTGTYTFNVTVDGLHLGNIEMVVAPSPGGSGDQVPAAALFIISVGAASILVGAGFVNVRGVVRGRKVERTVQLPKQPHLMWRWASQLLTYVVKNRWAQGFLQMPLFVLYIVAIYIGYFGTQDPTKNFATMVGWTYYLAGILLLYAIFGRLWCYVEACGFVDTWAKNLKRGKSWLEWPSWLKNLWPGFFILLVGFWVEIVLSIDLYPWAVATFMLGILLINVFISSIFSKRTYCRYVCRDGVVEELIARYSILRIGVRYRLDSVPRNNVCIWTDEEKRPGFCSMCFSCVQNDPTVREATVEPAIESFAEDVFKPQAVHRDEATAAIVLMGISIPYMLVLTGLWWVGVAEASAALRPPLSPLGVVAVAAGLVLLVAMAMRFAVRRWPDTYTKPRLLLLSMLAGTLVTQFLLAGLGGEVGRIVALRSLIVLACFIVPFILVWSAEALVVRLTRNAREESAWRLLERYGLVFIPVFLGVLVARNLPLVGTWGWAVWDITVATFTEFPGGTVTPTPLPFVDTSYHFTLGVLALTLGIAVGAYAALQLSRRLYKEERDALAAFGVHVVTLVVFGSLFALILSLPPF